MEKQEENTIQKKGRGRPVTKNGNYDNKAYYTTFKEKNNNKIHQVIVCDVCGGHFSYFNKSHHKASRKHEKALNKTPPNSPVENIQQLDDE